MKYDYLDLYGHYILVAAAGFGFFIMYNTIAPLYFSVFVGCLVSALGASIIPPLKKFKLKK